MFGALQTLKQSTEVMICQVHPDTINQRCNKHGTLVKAALEKLSERGRVSQSDFIGLNEQTGGFNAFLKDQWVKERVSDAAQTKNKPRKVPLCLLGGVS